MANGDIANLVRTWRLLPSAGLVFLKVNLFQLLRIGCNLAPIIIVYIYTEELDNYLTFYNNTNSGNSPAISILAYVLLVLVAVFFIVGAMLPQLIVMFVEDAKKELQISQGTSLVAKVFDLELDVHISTPTGKFAQLLGAMYRSVDQLLPAALGKVYPIWAETFVATIVIGILFGPVCLLQVALVVIYSGLALFDAKSIQAKSKDNMMVLYKEYGKLLAILQRFEIAHHFNNVGHEVKNTRSSFAALSDSAAAMVRPGQISALKLNGISLVLTSGVVFVLLSLPALSFVEFGVLTYYYNTFNTSLALYAQGITDLLGALAEYDTIIDFIDQVSPVADKPDADVMKLTKTPHIEFKNVCFGYGEKQILDNISFVVKPGTTLAVTGASGAGKSTIMKLLLRFYTPQSGEILVNGVNINDVTAKSLRTHMSVVTQHTSMFNNTLRANVEYGKLGSSDAEIRQALVGAELDVDAKDSPITLLEDVGEGGDKLSGGQKQRVAIARALLKHGCLYLLDEPTTALDSLVAHSVQTTLNKITDELTTLFVTHKLDHVTNVDQIIYLSECKIVERGTYQELMEMKGGFADQVRSQNITYVADVEGHKEEQKSKTPAASDDDITIHIQE